MRHDFKEFLTRKNIIIMGTFASSTTGTVIAFVIICIINGNLSVSQYQHPKQGAGQPENWPVELTFHETKTNAMLGEAILKRVYNRIGFSDNIIRAEVDTLFENLKEVIEKRLRKCERKRRRAGSVRSYGHDYDHYNSNSHQVNASLASQYAPRRTTRY